MDCLISLDVISVIRISSWTNDLPPKAKVISVFSKKSPSTLWNDGGKSNYIIPVMDI